MILHALAVLGALCILCSVLTALIVVISIARSRSDPYPPQAAEAPDPVDEHFTTAPRESDAELDRLVEQFDWARYKTWLKDPAPEEAP